MKCALYVRVSTDEQDMANQTMVLRELAKARGFEIVEVFQEEEIKQGGLTNENT